jgi:hypothetical protein
MDGVALHGLLVNGKSLDGLSLDEMGGKGFCFWLLLAQAHGADTQMCKSRLGRKPDVYT